MVTLMEKPELLVAIPLASQSIPMLEQVCILHHATTYEERIEIARTVGPQIRAILTNGTTIIPDALIELLPNLSIICAQGVGFEGIDAAAARARGIMITHGPGTNDDCVADHAMALLLAVLRDIPNKNSIVRAGRWREGGTMRPFAKGKCLGILGLGEIGSRIARRAMAFDMDIIYHNRRMKQDVSWRYAGSPLKLAEQSDILLITVPGGAETHHIVDGKVLAALGKDGFLINVGRGSVVDTEALIEALRDGVIAGAGLDVVEGEPVVPQPLRDLSNVIITPHMAGRSWETIDATIKLVIANLQAHFSGQKVLTPAP